MTGTSTTSTASATSTATAPDWQAWQDSWDRQQEWYMPDREERFRVMLDMTEALTGTSPVVLDLACGTGTITDRVLRRFPAARSTGVDLDPALLAIGRGHFAGDDRMEFVTADLTDPQWTSALPHRSYDAVLTATALHWLPADALRTLYGQIAEVLREGGVFMNADHMADESAPRINAAAREFTLARQQRERAAGALDWSDWWREVADDPVLGEPALRRFALLGDPRVPPDGRTAPGSSSGPASSPADGTPDGTAPGTASGTARGPARTRPSTGWHADTLREAGFSEARQVWCSPSDAVMAGLR